LQRHF